jgi:hypothetical protein
MRFGLGTLLIVLAIAPPILAWLWSVLGPLVILAAIYLLITLLLTDAP